MRQVKSFFLAMFAVVALSGCATMQAVNPFDGVDAPETPTEVLGYVEATRAAVARSATTALEEGRIDVDTAKDIDSSLDDVARIADEAALFLADGDEQKAESRLNTAQAILTQIEKRLAEAADEQ